MMEKKTEATNEYIIAGYIRGILGVIYDGKQNGNYYVGITEIE